MATSSPVAERDLPQRTDRVLIGGRRSRWVRASRRGGRPVDGRRDRTRGRRRAGQGEPGRRGGAGGRKRLESHRAGVPGEVLDQVADRISVRIDEFAAVIAAEMGAPVDNAREVQTGLAVDVFPSYAAVAREFDWRKRSAPEWCGTSPSAWSGRSPVELSALPRVHQDRRRTGCRVYGGLRAQPDAPLDATLLAEIIVEVADELGAPVGIVDLVLGTGGVVGEAMPAHPGIAAVSLTGSTEAGRRVAATAVGTMERVGFGLGGESAAIILDDAFDPESRLDRCAGRRVLQLRPDLYGLCSNSHSAEPISRGDHRPPQTSPPVGGSVIRGCPGNTSDRSPPVPSTSRCSAPQVRSRRGGAAGHRRRAHRRTNSRWSRRRQLGVAYPRRRCLTEHGDRARGDLRPHRGVDGLRRRRQRGPHRQRLDLRSVRGGWASTRSGRSTSRAACKPVAW